MKNKFLKTLSLFVTICALFFIGCGNNKNSSVEHTEPTFLIGTWLNEESEANISLTFNDDFTFEGTLYNETILITGTLDYNSKGLKTNQYYMRDMSTSESSFNNMVTRLNNKIVTLIPNKDETEFYFTIEDFFAQNIFGGTYIKQNKEELPKLTGLTDLEVDPGNRGEFTYSFSATDPTADVYMLYYIEGDRNTEETIAYGINIPASANSTEIISDLKDDTLYSIVIVAEKDGFESVTSNVKQVRTMTPGTLSGSNDLELKSVNHGELTYSFSATEPAADTYTLYFAEGTHDTDALITNGTQIEVTPRTSEVPGIISSLKDNTLYSIVVVAEKHNFETLIFDIKQATTRMPSLTGPTDLQVKSGNRGELTYSFSASSPAADTYELYYIEGNSNLTQIIADGVKITTIPANTDSPRIITGLKDDTLYSVAIVAEKDNFESFISNIEQAITIMPGTISGLPDLEIKQGNNPGELTYSFSATIPAALSYTLYYYRGVAESVSDILNTGTHMPINPATITSPGIITGLDLAAVYSIVVVAEQSLDNVISPVRRAYTDWLQGLTDIQITLGTDNGTLNYSFSATNPPADSYTLYYYEGETSNPAAIIANGTPIAVPPALSGTITELNMESNYSIVVVAKYDGLRDSISTIETILIDYVAWIPEDLNLQVTANWGEFIYSFNATNPAAEKYTLYCYDGTTNNISVIIENGTPVAATGLLGTITELKANTDYSFVVVAEYKTLPPIISSIGTARIGLTDLAIKRGGVNPYGIHLGATDLRALAYSFDAPYPPADSYTLYYIAGTASANDIISDGIGVQVEPKTTANPGFVGGVSSYEYDLLFDDRPNEQVHYIENISYVIDADTPIFEIDETYSVVVVARKAGNNDLVSSVIQIGRVPNNILTIPDASAEVRIAVLLTGRSILAIAGAAGRVPVAVAYRLPGTNMFAFYEVTNGVYDPTTPLTHNTGNTRYVALSSTERQPPSLTDGRSDGHFRYLSGSSMISPRLITITNRFSLNMSEFFRQ